jgi:hypothetical protein
VTGELTRDPNLSVTRYTNPLTSSVQIYLITYQTDFPHVFGLLVDQPKPRLPKRYRNRLRMMRYMLKTDHLTEKERARFAGHVAYAESVR